MADDEIKDDINKLKSSILDLPTLLSLLCRPLHAVGLLPPQFHKYSTFPPGSRNVLKHYHVIQKVLLEHILPTWDHILAERGLSGIPDQYFCPDSFSFTSATAGQVVLISYSTILSLPLNEYAIRFLLRFSKEYPIDRLQQAVFDKSASTTKEITWEDCVRNITAVPAKVANSLAGKGDIPDELEHGAYFNHVCLRTEHLIWSTCTPTSILQEKLQSIVYLLNKLVQVGVFPPFPPTTRSQPSFFSACLHVIRERTESSDSYARLWSSILTSLPSSMVIRSVFMSLFSSLENIPPLDTSPRSRGIIKQEALLLQGVVGELTVDKHELWDSVSAVILGREWNETKARISVCWIAINDKAVELLLSKVLSVWTSSDHIKHSLLSRHHYITSLFLITISYLSPESSQVSSLATSSSFISGVGIYIKHLDPDVRRCGMLVAEEVARRAGKKLDFGGWDGEDAGRIWAKSIRNLIAARDIDFNVTETETEAHPENAPPQTTPTRTPLTTTTSVIDSDDESVQGYASSDDADRSPSPTPSDLAEIEKDPTLNVGTKKISRPVYLAQLGELVRSTTAGLKSGENQEPQKIEMTLSCGEELIRRKRAFGTELDENAVNLVYAFVGLQDTYELDGFDVNRQAIVSALVACCPRKAAPAIIEEFFKNQYSTDQRFVMLTGLALGAREIASLPIPPSTVSKVGTSFPTKQLPPLLHQKMLGGNSVQRLLADISQNAIDKSKNNAVDKTPEFVRERRLRLTKPPKITTVSSSLIQVPTSSNQTVSFTDIAVEFFICPFINRFWLFLRDEQTRETRSSYQSDPLYRYRGSGTGLVLNPMVLSQFLSTLGVLIHAARNAPQWLAVVAPDGLELAVTLGVRPVSRMEEEADDDEDDGQERADGEDKSIRGKEALVLTTALELAIVVLDGCLELDGGKSLGLEHTNLLLGAGEWAGKLLTHLEKGILVPGGGGVQELRLKRAAAGVVLKVDEVTSKWGRSMINVF